jgi:N-terminal domain of galactosyltransferase
MSLLLYVLRALRNLGDKLLRRRVNRISLIVPFRTDHAERERNWQWLERYWAAELPEAEVITGTDDSTPFCKTRAVNDAFTRAAGDIIVILDADCYISAGVIREAARQIRRARMRGRHLWFIPYRRFYRLTEAASLRLLASDPASPVTFPDPPPPDDVDTPGGESFGHWYGALIQVMPREAFIRVGGMDERFRGWGGEDISFMHAVDTLYGRHKTIPGPVYHVHHPVIKGKWKFTRQWAGQDGPETNDWLSTKYEDAVGDKARMIRLINS